jgi:hypothetical protein
MIDPDKLETLILARLAVPRHSPLTLSKLSRAMSSFLAAGLSAAESRHEILEAVKRLREARQIDAGALTLLDDGRNRLCAALRVPLLPGARNWAEFKRKHLVRLFHAESTSKSAKNLGLVLIARKLELPDDAARSESALADACLAKALRLDGKYRSMAQIRTAFLANVLGVPVRPKTEQVLRISAAAISGARTAGTEDIVHALTVSWLSGTGTPGDARGTASDTARPPGGARGNDDLFSRTVGKVLEATRNPSAKHYGPDKVFIASVWDNLRNDTELSELDESAFKTLLVEAHRRGALTLSRADLVAAMDPVLVAASETQHLNATFHFIDVSGDQT